MLAQHIQRAHLDDISIHSHRQTTGTYHRQPKYHTTPEANVVEHLFPFHELRSLNHDNGQLTHLRQETISPQLLSDATHDDLMPNSTDEKSDQSSHRPTNMRSATLIHMSPEKMVNRNVPLSAEFQPVRRIPPVVVEAAISEAGDLRHRTEDVLEDDEEYEKKRHHEGEKQHRN